MRGRSWRFLVVTLMVSSVVGGISSLPASAATRISYSGQSFSVKATVSSSTTVLADTGSLPSSGGALEASSLSALVQQTVTADSLHAMTIGQGDRVRSEASVANIVTTGGLNTVSADFAMSRAMAVSHGNSPQISGLSQVDSLVVNGEAVSVTGQPNQTLPLIDGQLVINEQITSVSGDTGTITVNALHIILPGGTDVVLGSSRAGVVAGSQSCSSTDDFTSGGGWVFSPSGGPKRTFGLIGGVRQGPQFFGHFLYVNHATNQRVNGRVDLYTVLPGTVRNMEGTGEANGQPATFQLTVADNGEPGSQDTITLTWQGGGGGSDNGTLGGGNIQLHQPCR
jgi:hypothetical protein